MRVSIINGDAGDDTVVIDGRSFAFDLTGLIDECIWAVQWQDQDGQASGEIEYRDGSHEPIDTLTPFQPIIERWHAEKDREAREAAQQQAFFHSRQFAIDVINNTAGKARQRASTIGYGMTDEYSRVQAQAQRYAETGFSGAVPQVVRTHAEVHGVSPQQAAEQILAAAERWAQRLDAIRDLRLRGTAAVAALAEGENYMDTAKPFIQQLKAL
ncbi:hypothetical protein [Microbulbifer spongiae]|uniref:Uncharacterized protein n=1 Tax=Microbulbifer spongiae TaxID=2944933 RepID=A0ABY9E5N8_9GAMM|nr:hypothetical protein [Microbulbifer sp. MI-G]WKD48330.1 hypothetical protein M8T91_10325 [Microbulbifer sp. MI-G]